MDNRPFQGMLKTAVVSIPDWYDNRSAGKIASEFFCVNIGISDTGSGNNLYELKEFGVMVIPGNQIKKKRHRQRLIDAAIEVVSEFGIAGASVTRIITRAKLSRGMIHLHFDNKEHLLIEAARHMSEAYYTQLETFLQPAGNNARDRLRALISADLSDKILNPRTVNAWFAFRGEARSHKSFARHSDTRDDALKKMLILAYCELAEGRNEPDALARDAAHGTIALLEGMWADYLLHPDAFNRNSAKRIVFRFVSALFPGCL